MKRSLGTEDETEATRLVSQLDELLGDTGLHSLSKRREAERRFDVIVVSAFYDKGVWARRSGSRGQFHSGSPAARTDEHFGQPRSFSTMTSDTVPLRASYCFRIESITGQSLPALRAW